MKKVVLTCGARVCSRCGETIKHGEVCYLQKRPKFKTCKTKYVCKKCWERITL